MIYVDGISRGLRWNGVTATADALGITAPGGGPTMASSSGSSLSYYAGYRFVDRDKVTPSSLSTLRLVTSGATSGITYTWTTLQSSSQSRVELVEAWRTTSGQATAVYRVYIAGISKNISSVTNSGGFCLFTMSDAHGYEVGDFVVAASASVAVYNQTHRITSIPTSTTFITDVGYTANASASGTARQRVFQFGESGNLEGAENSGGKIRLDFGTSPPRLAGSSASIGCKITVTGTGIASVDATHHITAVLFGSGNYVADTDTNYVEDAGAGTWTLTGLAENLADTDFTTSATEYSANAMAILNPDGSLNARRFVPPPTFRAVAVRFQDRMWYAVDVYYNSGTVTTNGSTTLEGSGTKWNSDFVGRYVYIATETRPYIVQSVTDADTLILDRATATSTAGLAYVIAPDPAYRSSLFYSEVDEPESCSLLNDVIIQENTDDNDIITGLMPHGSALYVLKERHVYRVTYQSQPRINPNVSIVAFRGCINHRCRAMWQGQAYMMDTDGVWRFGLMGSGTDPISGPIQNYFRDGALDWANSHHWFASVDHEHGVLRWHVKLSTDTGTRPKRALCYSVHHNEWWTESYVSEMGGACCIPISGRMRTLFASEDDQIMLTGQGTTDGVTSATTGTATSGTSTTLVKTGAGWTVNQFRYASVGITAGTGKGQIRRISSNTSDTLTVPAWTTTPDSTSQFAIGAVPWSWRSGLFRIPTEEDDPKAEFANERAIRFTYSPTTNAASLDVRTYYNHGTSATNNRIPTKPNPGVQTTASDPDAVVDLKLTRSGLANASGDIKVPISSRASGLNVGGDRWVAYELRGMQTDDRIIVHSVTLIGVLQ